MRICVKLFLHLKKHAPAGDGSVELELPADATVETALARLGVPRETCKVVLVDGRHRAVSHCLRDGETLTVFPPLDGG